jgi:hypothetical protein
VVTHQAQGLLVLGAGLLVTTMALSIASGAGVRGAGPELAVLTTANLLVTIGRFAAFRLWVFRSPRTGSAYQAAPSGAATAQPCEGGSLAAAPAPLAQDQA